MMSPSVPGFMTATCNDAMDFKTPIDLKNISEVEARILMSAEHKALGYRPPAGSLAAEAQAAAAKNPQAPARIPEGQLAKAALEDALRIKREREVNGVDLSAIGEVQARKLISEEYQALGHRPPPDTLAAHPQVAAAGQLQGAVSAQLLLQILQRATLEDAASQSSSATADIDLDFIGQAEARRLMSEEHKALGYRPPQGSLAAAAQSAAAKHPHASAGLDPITLAKAALEDAKKIDAERRAAASESSDTKPSIDITVEEVYVSQSEVEMILEGSLPADLSAACMPSTMDVRIGETVTREAGASIRSDEPGYHPESMDEMLQNIASQQGTEEISCTLSELDSDP